MEQLLEEMRTTYDIVLIDTSALLDFPDGRIFARMSDGAVLASNRHQRRFDRTFSAQDSVGRHSRVGNATRLADLSLRRRTGRTRRLAVRVRTAIFADHTHFPDWPMGAQHWSVPGVSGEPSGRPHQARLFHRSARLLPDISLSTGRD